MSTWNESDLEHFGRRLAAARKQAGVNQTELASWAGIGRPTLSRYERGEVAPTADVLAALASRLQPHGISLEWLLYGGKAADDENCFSIRLKGIGALTALRFTAGGIGEVLMSMGDVKRILQAWGDLEKAQPEPNQAVLESMESILAHFYERYEEIEIMADVPIAVHGVKLTPAIPDSTKREDLSRWSVSRGMEPSPEPAEDDSEKGGVRQDISGEGHQIAGGDIQNNGGVSIGRSYKK